MGQDITERKTAEQEVTLSPNTQHSLGAQQLPLIAERKTSGHEVALPPGPPAHPQHPPSLEWQVTRLAMDLQRLIDSANAPILGVDQDGTNGD